MLVLLAAAVTGAWAQTTYNVTFSANGNTKTKENVTLPYQFKCDLYNEDGELDEIIQELYELSSGGFCNGHLSASGSSQVSVGSTDEDDDYITINGPIDGTATVTGTYHDYESENSFDYSIQITTTEYTPPSYLYLVFAGTSATLKYGPVPANTGYYDHDNAQWEENGYGNDPFWDTYWACTTLYVDESCQNFTESCLSALLAYMSNLTTIINISNLNTANVTNMDEMFKGCSSLETLNLSGWNTANVTNTNNMFDGCTKLNKSVTANEGATGEYWATYCNSALGYTADANTTVYQAAVNGTKTGVVLTEVTGREIPAGQGVVLKSSAATIALTPALTTQTLTGNELLGTDFDLPYPGGNVYCLSKSGTAVGFYTYTSTDGASGNGTIPAHKAYLVVASAARSFLGFGGSDNTTGIALPEAVVIENDGPIYDLSGRRIEGQPQKGIYVKNGKKVVIK